MKKSSVPSSDLLTPTGVYVGIVEAASFLQDGTLLNAIEGRVLGCAAPKVSRGLQARIIRCSRAIHR